MSSGSLFRSVLQGMENFVPRTLYLWRWSKKKTLRQWVETGFSAVCFEVGS